MNSNLNKLFPKKAYWKKKRNKCLNRFYHSTIWPWLMLVIVSLIYWLISWGVLATWFLIVFAISSSCWGIYWIIKVEKCSQKLAIIDKKIAEELSNQ